MMTLNESLTEEFRNLVDEFDFSELEGQKIDKEKLTRIYKVLLNHKDDNENFEKSARTVVNTVLDREFNS